MSDQDFYFENNLRPNFLDEYVGQEEIKSNLNIAIQSAKKRQEALDHVLLFGPPGLGKTTLAFLIGKETGFPVKVTSGAAMDKQGDVAAILSNLQLNEILFIDEIHRLKPAVEETLYSAMEDFGIDIMIGKGPAARIMRLSLPKFTLIGATTKISKISAPLRDRFSIHFAFDFYDNQQLASIIRRSADILDCKINREAAVLLASCCRGTPRIANRLLKYVRDFAVVHCEKLIDENLVNNSLKKLGIDHLGLNPKDRQLLNTLVEKFRGGPVGLSTISAAISEEENTIEDIYEPFLIQLGFLERTPKGRIVTEKGYVHLGSSAPLRGLL